MAGGPRGGLRFLQNYSSMFTFDQQNEEREDGGNFDDVNIETELISTAPRWRAGEVGRYSSIS